jgi:hypothetical protein
MAAPVKFTRHPPERRRSGSIVLAMGGGCACTCCCCLHTLGAIAGAIVGSALPLSPPKQERYENAPEKPSPKVAAIFWALSGLVSLGVLGYYAVSGGAGPGDNLLGAGIILLLVGIPGAFLAAALVTAIVIPLAYQDVGLAFRRLGYIFGLALAGFALGAGVMVLVSVALESGLLGM